MKNLKKFVALFLAGALALLMLTACGGGGSSDEQKEAAMVAKLNGSSQSSASGNDATLRKTALADLNTDIKAGNESGFGFKGRVRVDGISPAKENITITVTTDYKYGSIVKSLLGLISTHIGTEYPGANVDVNAKGCWTKVAVAVKSDGNHTYMAVAIQMKNLAYNGN